MEEPPAGAVGAAAWDVKVSSLFIIIHSSFCLVAYWASNPLAHCHLNLDAVTILVRKYIQSSYGVCGCH